MTCQSGACLFEVLFFKEYRLCESYWVGEGDPDQSFRYKRYLVLGMQFYAQMLASYVKFAHKIYLTGANNPVETEHIIFSILLSLEEFIVNMHV